mmetsp:Transcript_11931/g.10300  ORF Transcript_11931/g.10300 Transcript_11931/m.10300 type:complete len:89 (-) Transcript_11931:392-658(-)
MTYFYKYAYYENQTLAELVKNRSSVGIEYVKRKRDLQFKKEKMFGLQDITKWEIPTSTIHSLGKESILKDRNIAYAVMLPKETQQVLE